MAFSSSSHSSGNSNIRRGVAAAAASLLPFSSSSTTTKSANSKQHIRNKSRKRTALKDFISANFFIIGLSASILFFLFIVSHYGVPSPLSISSQFRNSRVFKPRKPIHHRKPSPSRVRVSFSNRSNLAAAAVDLTTKDLYDKIEFKDVDGGPWTQGWRVSYKGDEWDNEKLKVFVVPHSHNDPGWKLTVEEYYDRQSRHILDTIVDTLSKDERRKFIWEEMSYLERWWRDASDAKRESFTNLLQNGQLEIVGGGWVMNDEVI